MRKPWYREEEKSIVDSLHASIYDHHDLQAIWVCIAWWSMLADEGQRHYPVRASTCNPKTVTAFNVEGSGTSLTLISSHSQRMTVEDHLAWLLPPLDHDGYNMHVF